MYCKFRYVLGQMNCYVGPQLTRMGKVDQAITIGVSGVKGGTRFAVNGWNKPQNFT